MKQTQNGEMFLTYPHTVRRIAARGTAHTLRRLVQIQPEGYIRLKADASISSKELYEAYQIYCAENNLTTMKPCSFSDAVIGSQSRYNLEYCNNVTNAAGRRVRGFFGIEALVHPNISVFSGDSLRTYVPRDTSEGWRD